MRILLGFLLGAAAGGFLVSGVRERMSPTLPPLPTNLAGTPSPLPTKPLRAGGPTLADATSRFLVARLADDGPLADLFVVTESGVEPVPFPKGLDGTVPPVSDGERFYGFIEDSARGRRLGAFERGKETETIAGSTARVRPRGLWVSPGSNLLAYFLDDRLTDATELWVYDTRTRRTRVAVERLSRATVHGPFLAPDGNFLLVAGGKVLAVSARVVAEPLLEVVPAPRTRVRWENGLVRSSGGSKFAIVVESRENGSLVAAVAEYSARAVSDPKARADPRVRFSATGKLTLLGWRDPDELLVLRAQGDGEKTRLSLVRVGAGAPVTYGLGEGITSPTLLAEGASLAFLRTTKEGTDLEVLDVATGQTRAVRALGEGTFRLVQTVPSPGTSKPVVSPPAVGLPLRGLLTLLAEQARAFTDAPPGESVSLERIWLTRTEGSVYVDYRIGSTLWRRLVRVREGRADAFVVEAVGVFTPVGGEWVLARGEDLPDPTPTALYEFEADARTWVEKPLAAGGAPG